ncbi:sensor histidine kinase [Acidobacterium sp. S8]|uniref:sensor histidine kinase n=1 Tax=Acidobacterium sp. S8 TaxID=1641854 RepID=UPI00131DE13D|nr:sensor histidine kinase [Acidobacterium sp. S8]
MPIHRHFWCAALLLLATLHAVALDPHYPLQHYGFQSWQADDGLPQNTVHTVLQTRDGYIWLGTEAGLVRFDGVQFTVFDKKSSPLLGSDLISSLLEDRNGTLWIGTSGGLTRLERGEFHTFTAHDGLPAVSVLSLHLSRDGSLWALTAAGLAKYAEGRFQPVAVPQGLSDDSAVAETPDGSLWVNSGNSLMRVDVQKLSAQTVSTFTDQIETLAADSHGTFWIGLSGGLKRVSQNGKPIYVPSLETLRTDVTALLSATDGRLWIGTANGVAVFDGNNAHFFTQRDGLPGNRVLKLFEDREHAIWTATNHGIARVADGRVSALASKEGLSTDQVLSFFEDREGSLWLGTESGGLSILRDRKFTTYTTDDGLTDELVRSVFQERNGAMLIGTNGGGVNQWMSSRFSSLAPSGHLSSNVVLALTDDPDGNLWIGTPDGLNRVKGNQTTVFTSADGLADDFVRSLYTDRSGAVWIGTRRGLSRYKDGAFTSYAATDGLGNDLVGAILQDKDGSMWIGTLGGLSHFTHGKFQNFSTQQGLSSDIITALHQDADGNLWIGTSGGGLSVRHNGKFVSLPPDKTGLPEDIYGILDDGQGNLWLGSKKGIFRASKNKLLMLATGNIDTISPDVFGTADGMRISECSSGGHPAAWRAKDGSLWFATLRGVSTVDPAHMPVNRVAPLVAMEQVSVDETAIPLQRDAKFGPGHTRFAFQYAGLSFVVPQKVRFRYKLEGLDREWVDAGTRRIAYYTNIPPGRHTFRVMACNNDGVWSEQAAAFSFQLKPRFYQTYWFYIAVLLCLAVLTYEAYRWRVRSVESRFSAVLAERNRIAREIHDTLAQGFVAVSVQIEVVSRLLNTSTDAARIHLEQARKLTQESLAEARSSIWNLRSQPAAQNDLPARLTDAVARITANTDVQARVQVSGTFRPLNPNMEAELLRIGQEAMTNIVRHAEARHADVTLLFQENRLRMTIQDDGRGFEGSPEEYRKNGHFGITGMRERAEQIGARFTVTSKQDEGTAIQVEVPL